MSNTRVSWVLLCEDTQHAVFLRHFLIRHGVHRRTIRELPRPDGRGDARKWISDRFGSEVAALRNYARKNASANQVLVVMTDADNLSVRQRREQLTKQLGQPLLDTEPIMVCVAKWAIETWLSFVSGEAFDENTPIRPRQRFSRPRDCKPLVDQLAELCKQGESLKKAPPSLIAACRDYVRLRNLIA